MRLQSRLRWIPTNEQVASGRVLWADSALQGHIERHIGALVLSISSSVPFRVEEADLRQAGWVGAWVACCRFDRECRTKATTYVAHYVRGWMRNHVRSIARERGCSGAVWAAGGYEEREVSFDALESPDAFAALADGAAEAAMADACDGDWQAFRSELPPLLLDTLDGMLEGLDGHEAGLRRGITRQGEHNNRRTVRRLWREFGEESFREQ